MKDNLLLEQLIIASSVFALCLIEFIFSFVKLKTKQDQKVSTKVHWFKNLILRVIITILLVGVAISIALLLGSENIFEPTALFRWAVPTIFISNITLKWFFLFCFAKNKKYIVS